MATEKQVSQTTRASILKPLRTEKILAQLVNRKYAFSVAPSANKILVKKAVFELYGVKPVSVNMILMEGKKVGMGKLSGHRKNWKKAIVTLKEGESINLEK